MGNKNRIPQPITKGVANVPVVMQLEVLECGAASLAMIMHYYKNGSRSSRQESTAASPGTALPQKISSWPREAMG